MNDSTEVLIGGYLPCGCLVYAAALPDQHNDTPWSYWQALKSELYGEANAGVELRLIPKARIVNFAKCPHTGAPFPDTALIQARDGVIAAVEVMMRVRGLEA